MLILRTVFYATLFGGTLCVLFPWLIITVFDESRTSIAALSYSGFAVLGLGIAVAAWCAALFCTAGQGTTAPFDPPNWLVAQGLYRYTRNPMYLGGMVILVGEALLFASLWLLAYAALVGLKAHLFVVLCEEPALEHRFGQAYLDYQASTPRWLLGGKIRQA